MDFTATIAGHIARARLEAIPTSARDRAKISILDTIGTMIGGTGSEIAGSARAFAVRMGGTPESHLVGMFEKFPAGIAAFVNATTARVLDFDETFEITQNGCHASAYDIPPALALAERDPTVTGAEFLVAVAVAMDVHMRLSRSILASPIDTGRDNGVSVFGATVAAAKILRLTQEETLNALGIAYAQAAGEFQMYEETSHTISLQQGIRARAGVDSAVMASIGLDGPHEVFAGKYGFFHAFEPDYDRKLILDGLGNDFVGSQISFKRYPCCRATHTGISAMLDLRQRENFRAGDIESVTVKTTKNAIAIVAEPHLDKWDPRNPVTAKFSLPYCVAVAAVKGSVDLADFTTDALRDAEVRQIMSIVKVERDLDIETRAPVVQNAPCEVVVQLKGRTVSLLVERPPGHPRNPVNFADAAEKLHRCNEISSLSYSRGKLDEVTDIVFSLETANLRQLFTALFAPLH